MGHSTTRKRQILRLKLNNHFGVNGYKTLMNLCIYVKNEHNKFVYFGTFDDKDIEAKVHSLRK